MAEVRISLKARPYQQPLIDWFRGGGKRAACVWHRRAGKDEVALHWTAVSAARKPAVYWHMLPQAEQARKAIWDAVNPHTGKRRLDEVWPEAFIASKREDIMQLKLRNGAIWQVVGSDNYNSLIGSPPYGVVFSEWAVADPMAWDYIRPILAENGGWAIWPYTPRGQNHGYDLFEAARRNPAWFCERLSIEDTGAIPMSVVDEERASGALEELIKQEYWCSFVAPNSGSYYGQQMNDAEQEGRVLAIKPSSVVGVTTAWDLGIGDTTAIWFAQVVGMEVHLIDYLCAAGQPLEYYVRELEKRAETMGYRYVEHLLPHDAEARELGTGVTRIETLRALNLKGPLRIVDRHRVEDGINAARVMLPHCWFDEERCKDGIKALRSYRRAYDDKARTFSHRPLHDWASNGSDSFRYLSMGLRPQDARRREVRHAYDGRQGKFRRGSAWAG